MGGGLSTRLPGESPRPPDTPARVPRVLRCPRLGQPSGTRRVRRGRPSVRPGRRGCPADQAGRTEGRDGREGPRPAGPGLGGPMPRTAWAPLPEERTWCSVVPRALAAYRCITRQGLPGHPHRVTNLPVTCENAHVLSISFSQSPGRTTGGQAAAANNALAVEPGLFNEVMNSRGTLGGVPFLFLVASGAPRRAPSIDLAASAGQGRGIRFARSAHSFQRQPPRLPH